MSFVARILDTLGLGPDQFEPGRPDAHQAVIDLLELVMLVDGTSADAERERIRRHLDAQDWPAGSNPESYAAAATAKVRAALADDAGLERLLSSITERLATDDDRAFALELVGELAGVDGAVDAKESALLLSLRRRFDEA